MKILILNWRDIKNPRAGGAEVLTHEMAKGWVQAGHNVTFFTASFKGAKPEEVLDGVNVRLTNIERTLVDAVVRPEYSGGPNEVLTAFRNAAENVSINKLVSMLKRIDHVYPYHQAIGFYLEKSGAYRQSQIDLLRKQEMRYDFYLMHQIKDAKFSSRWKLYYPESLG